MADRSVISSFDEVCHFFKFLTTVDSFSELLILPNIARAHAHNSFGLSQSSLHICLNPPSMRTVVLSSWTWSLNYNEKIKWQLLLQMLIPEKISKRDEIYKISSRPWAWRTSFRPSRQRLNGISFSFSDRDTIERMSEWGREVLSPTWSLRRFGHFVRVLSWFWIIDSAC